MTPAQKPPAVDSVAAQINARLAQLGLLSAPHDLSSLDEMVLAPQVRQRLSRVVLEQSRRDVLLSRGLRPSRKILFFTARSEAST